MVQGGRVEKHSLSNLNLVVCSGHGEVCCYLTKPQRLEETTRVLEKRRERAGRLSWGKRNIATRKGNGCD